MKSEKANRKRSKEIAEFTEKLFGRVEEMGPEEIEELFSEIAPNEDPGQRVYEIAEKCARRFRLGNRMVPSHVEAALKATRPITSLERADRRQLLGIIQDALKPHSGRARDISYAFQRKGDVTQEDLDILKELSKELEDDSEE